MNPKHITILCILTLSLYSSRSYAQETHILKFATFSELNTAKYIFEYFKEDSISVFSVNDFLGTGPDTLAEYYYNTYDKKEWEFVRQNRIEIYRGDELHFSSEFRNDSLLKYWYFEKGRIKIKEIYYCDGNHRLACFMILGAQYFPDGTPYFEINPIENNPSYQK